MIVVLEFVFVSEVFGSFLFLGLLIGIHLFEESVDQG